MATTEIASLSSTTETSSLPSTTSFASENADRDEQASAKLWAVYISEAEKYDKALVEGWKSDMEGLLIFAGLFSASLTAFLIESYKTLSPDQGAITIALLAQISRQLDPSSSTTPPPVDSSSFTPSTASLACNTLWFLSLGLSLSCALIATLVEQWARDFIQRTEMRPSPIIRARIFSYLYFGMQRFSMHTIVGFIPLLLHVSLLLFFAGLVAFLRPINPVLMAVAAAMLGLISAIYSCLTILPIISSDAPYRTPLSNVAWGLYQRFSIMLYWRRKSLPDEENGMMTDHKSPLSDNHIPTMVAVMNRDAVVPSSQRDKRDGLAIVWTFKSLTDNNELQPFVEALPDLIYGPNGRRGMYDHMISMLLADRDIRLVQRIENLLQTCDSGLLHPDHETWCRIISIKALWAIAYFLASHSSTQRTFPVFDRQLLSSQLAHPRPIISYSASTVALVQWIGFCAVSAHVQTVLSMLAASPAGDDLGTLHTAIRALQLEANVRGYVDFCSDISQSIPDAFLPMEQYRDNLVSFKDKAYDSFVEYIQFSASLDEMPFEFQATCAIIQPSSRAISSTVRAKLEKGLTAAIENSDLLAPEVHQIDIIVDMVLRLLQTGSESLEIGLEKPIVAYITDRVKLGAGFNKAMGRCNPNRLSSMLIHHLVSGASTHNMRGNTLYSVYTLCMYYPQLAAFDEQTLAIVEAFPGFPIFPCVMAVLKWHILSTAAELPPDQAHSLMDRLQIWPSIDLAERLKGAPLTVLIDWLEHITVSSSKNTLASTFHFLSSHCPQECHPLSFQQRFATWLFDTCHDPSISSEFHALKLLETIEDWLFQGSAEHFDDIEVRRTLAEAMVKQSGNLAQDESTGLRRQMIDVIIAQLKSPPDVDHRRGNAVSVAGDESTEKSDSSRISCDDGYNTPASQSRVDLHE
ncbi:hypothetical protein MVEN_01751000 [Mycena venus]|uniref:DUF6535 domain-containing protein n=1 Tax=Mycena venus TaxID=2733690 RepID=A0A8H7CPW9_9AGAR|nr:hypothetical protein MVEN_01751000 [Mycena venus]